jgi:hypothetical protein
LNVIDDIEDFSHLSDMKYFSDESGGEMNEGFSPPPDDFPQFQEKGE